MRWLRRFFRRPGYVLWLEMDQLELRLALSRLVAAVDEFGHVEPDWAVVTTARNVLDSSRLGSASTNGGSVNG